MSNDSKTSTRRSFFVQGGAVLGAGVAAAAGASGLTSRGRARQATLRPGDLEDCEAIRRLHVAYIAGVEDQTQAAAVTTHRAYRSNARQKQDSLTFSNDGQQAFAHWHVDVCIGTPLEGDCTAVQMARLQGNLADLRWESGRLAAHYVKTGSLWRLDSLRYLPA